MKTTIKVTTTTEKEIDIEFPVFMKWGESFFYKIISENCCLKTDGINITEYTAAISIGMAPENVECEEEEFKRSFSRVIDRYTALAGLGKDTELLCEEIKHNAVNDGIATTASHITPEFTSLLNTLTTK
jgi:hypothetical protein